MFSALKAFIEQYVDFTAAEYEAMQPLVILKKLQKQKYLLREGEIARHIYFTNKGFLRVFYNHKGAEITRDITPLHSFATALPSFINQQPSYEIIQAVTDCELLVIHHDDVEYLYENYLKWQKLGRRIIEEMFVESQNRVYAFITETAEERYWNFVKKYPKIIEEVPLQYIASYLGITSQSLSRLRKKLAENRYQIK